MNYEIVLTHKAKKQLQALSPKIQAAIAKGIDSLGEGLTHNCKKLAGIESSYRLRVGDYRVLFQINNGKLLIIVIKIGHRRDVYR